MQVKHHNWKDFFKKKIEGPTSHPIHLQKKH